jgi:hypothetical protein
MKASLARRHSGHLLVARSREIRVKPNAILRGHVEPPDTGVRNVVDALAGLAGVR